MTRAITLVHVQRCATIDALERTRNAYEAGCAENKPMHEVLQEACDNIDAWGVEMDAVADPYQHDQNSCALRDMLRKASYDFDKHFTLRQFQREIRDEHARVQYDLKYEDNTDFRVKFSQLILLPTFFYSVAHDKA